MACKGLDTKWHCLFVTCAQKRVSIVCGGHCDIPIWFVGLCCLCHLCVFVSAICTRIQGHHCYDTCRKITRKVCAKHGVQLGYYKLIRLERGWYQMLAVRLWQAWCCLLSLLISPDDWEDWRAELPHTNFGRHFQGTIRMFLPPQPSGRVLNQRSQLFRCPQCTLSQRTVVTCSDSVVIVTLWPFVSNSLAHRLA